MGRWIYNEKGGLRTPLFTRFLESGAQREAIYYSIVDGGGWRSWKKWGLALGVREGQGSHTAVWFLTVAVTDMKAQQSTWQDVHSPRGLGQILWWQTPSRVLPTVPRSCFPLRCWKSPLLHPLLNERSHDHCSWVTVSVKTRDFWVLRWWTLTLVGCVSCLPL